jgi:hypothetical protein
MRIWSIHPSYLDSKGLVALWREGLLALHVLEGKTKGYKNHPQLDRFKAHTDPVKAINCYLAAVAEEARVRGYNFDRTKIKLCTECANIAVADGQLEYEMQHLLTKLQIRDQERFKELSEHIHPIVLHPLFIRIPGDIEAWEKIDKAA